MQHPVKAAAKSIALATLALAGSSLVTGCAFSNAASSAAKGTGSGGGVTTSSKAGLGGRIHGGSQPVNGATVALWAAGVAGTYGTGATQIATTTSIADGSFTFNNSTTGASPCTAGQYLYITATGGDAGAGVNNSLAEMAALPTPCGATTASTTVFIDEVTTVAAVTALQQFMSINTAATAPYAGTGTAPWTIGAPSTNTAGLANAFLQTANLANISTGLSATSYFANTLNSVVYTTTVAPDSSKINGLADVLAVCINDTTGNMCTGSQGVLTLTTIAVGATTPAYTVPVDTIQAAFNMASLPNAALYQGAKYWKSSTGSTTYLSTLWANVNAQAPFQPYTAAVPPDTAIGVSWRCISASNVTLGTVDAASVAIDGKGDIWTGAGSGATGNYINQFNQGGQLLQTVTTSSLPAYTLTYYADSATANTGATTANTTQALGYGRPIDAIAIDTNNNAWFNSYGAASPGTVATELTGITTEVTQTGAISSYLVGANDGALVIDGNNNLFMSNAPVSGRYYFSMTSAAGNYETNYEGIGRATGIYNDLAIDANGYAWAFVSACTAGETIPRINAAGMLTTTGTSAATSPVLASACAFYGAGDGNGNMWTTDGTNLDYINVGSSQTTPTVTAAFAGGSGTGFIAANKLAVDGAGNVWAVNKGTTSTSGSAGAAEFSTNGTTGTVTLLSPASTAAEGFGSDVTLYLGSPEGIALDPSGNVWFSTTGGSYLYYLVGIAAPTRTPLAAMYSHIGTKP